MPPVVMAGILLLLLQGRFFAGEDKEPAKPKEQDKQLIATLKSVINTGADIYNKMGDRNGCYRYYQGALTALRPMLEGHPKLQEEVKKGLADAERLPFPGDRAFALNKLLVKIHDHLSPKKGTTSDKKTLWDRLGGEENVTKIVDDFTKAAGSDKKVNFFRMGIKDLGEVDVPRFKRQMMYFISAHTDGPYQYKGKSMKDAHKGMLITDEEFDATAQHLRDALKKNGVAPDDIKAVMDVVEKTRKDIVEAKKGSPEKQTLWERLGGKKNVEKIIDDFIASAAQDPKVNVTRNGKYKLEGEALAKLKEHLIAFISQHSGGPIKYEGKNMKEVHKGMGITDAEYTAAEGHLKKALEMNDVAKDAVKEVMKGVEEARKEIVEKKGDKNGKAGDKDDQAASVSGKITFDGKPLAAGSVSFHSAKDKTAIKAKALINQDGTFAVKMPPGEYKVAVTVTVQGQNVIPARYGDPEKTNLVFQAAAGKNTCDLQLNSK
jgi:hemoglobin